jgi:hypothetical protein
VECLSLSDGEGKNDDKGNNPVDTFKCARLLSEMVREVGRWKAAEDKGNFEKSWKFIGKSFVREFFWGIGWEFSVDFIRF